MKKTKNVPKEIQALLKKNNGIRLDIGCGANKQPGFVGMDIRPIKGSVDIVQDLESFPWSLPDECVTTAVASHVLEHINPHKGVFIAFMDEVWRVMRPGGEFLIAVPYAGSAGYWQDPTHVNPCNENTWDYFDPEGPASGGMLWGIYRPKPWAIKVNTWNETGNMEVVLVKRAMQKKYEGFQ